METKDYFSLSFSAAALVISIYNLWQGFYDKRAIAKQKWNQMRFEAIAAVIGARNDNQYARMALETARYEALVVQDQEAIAAAENSLKSLENVRIKSEAIEATLRETPNLKGILSELSDMEGVLGNAKAQAVSSKASVLSANGTVEAIRIKLQAVTELKKSRKANNAEQDAAANP